MTKPSDEAMVTQADRDAAAAYMKRIGDNRWSQDGILSGGCDNCSVTQAFARHRQSAVDAERAEIVAWLRGHECQLFVPDGMMEPFDEAADAIASGLHRADGTAP